jgi:hypothetical protein
MVSKMIATTSYNLMQPEQPTTAWSTRRFVGVGCELKIHDGGGS